MELGSLGASEGELHVARWKARRSGTETRECFQVGWRPAKARESGMMPLEYLLSIMRDESQDAAVRRDAAKAAAPYCHARLASTEISGPDGGSNLIASQTTRVLDISDLNVAELDALEHALKKTIALQDAAAAKRLPPRGERGAAANCTAG